MKFKLLIAAVVLFAGLLALPWFLNVETTELDDAARADAPGQFADTPAGSTHYELSGPADGQPVVLVHGFASPYYVWDQTAPALAAAGFRVLRFDLMGRGWSERPDTVYDLALFEQQLLGLLDAVGMAGPVDIVGYSMGGAVVAHFANEHPERLRRMALIAPFNTAKRIGPVAWPVVGEYLASVLLTPRMPGRQALNFHDPGRFPDAADKFSEQMRFQGFGRAIHSSLKTIIATDHLADYTSLGKQDKPVLLLWGQEDRVVPFEQSERVRKALGKHTFLSIPETGHAPALEAATKVNGALLQFLR